MGSMDVESNNVSPADSHANRNYVDEFEQSFHMLLSPLTKVSNVSLSDTSTVKVDVEQNALRFLESAKELECFFLQKRFLLSVKKPEQLLREEISDLKHELNRKEQLIQRHYEKISMWQNLLSDSQPASANHSQTTENTPLMQSQQTTLQTN